MKNIYPYLLLILFVFACGDSKDELIDPYLTLELESNVLNIPIEGKSETIKIRTNLSDWELLPQASGGYDWCKTSIGLTASDIHILSLTVSPNEGMGTREAVFVLRGTGVENITFRVVQLGSEPAILVDTESKLLSKEEQTFIVKVTANVAHTCRNEEGWLTLVEKPASRGMTESAYEYKVTANTSLEVRRDVIHIESTGLEGEPVVVEIPVEQEAADVDEVIKPDTKIKVESVEMIQGTIYGVQAPELSIDDKLNTFYGSGKNAQDPTQPIIFDYTLAAGTEKVSYVRLTQKPGADITSGMTKGEIAYKSETNTEWVKCGSFDETEFKSTIQVDLDGAVNPTHLRLTMERASVGSVAIAEFECFQKAEGNDFDLTADAAYFEDNVFSRLKPTTTQADIAKITHPMVRAVAQELLNGTYAHEFRVRTYQSCKDPEITGSELTIGQRSACDNPTGLFFEQGKKYIIFVGDEIGDQTLDLYICDWRANVRPKQTVTLKNGLNTVDANVSGTGYIQYWTKTDDPAPAVKIHVCNGNEIGFWDVRAGHTNADWKRILALANDCAQRLSISNAMIDVSGELVQLINTVQAFNTYCPDDIEDVMKMHDELMTIEYTMMGLVKNNAVPRNRILGVRSWGDNPNWGGSCANFPNTEETMLNRSMFLSNLWVFGHEFGHGNQVAQMKGAGWAEVTNNIYAQQVLYLLHDGECRLEHTTYKRDGYTDKQYGDRVNAYLNDALIKGKPYLTHGGGLVEDAKNGTYYQADQFVSLVPLWQLSLFFMLAEGAPWHRPDFWPDVHWSAIQEHNPKNEPGKRYADFMRRLIDASGMDMTEFLEKIGLLRTYDMRVGDYGGPKQVTITQAMVDEIRTYGQSKPKVPTPVLYYISANSLEAYKKQLPVQGTFGQGITSGELSKTISHSVWKNVAAFETYAGDKMVEVCIAGTGRMDNTSTFVRYPEGATRIEAVSWDGKRTLVFGAR